MAQQSSKQEKILAFDPNGLGHPNGNLFGLPFTSQESDVVIIPVPWEATTSSRPGTAGAPLALLNASYQIDLLDPDVSKAWQMGIAMLPISSELHSCSTRTWRKAQKIIRALEGGRSAEAPTTKKLVDEVNSSCMHMSKWVREQAREWLVARKIVGVLGGDHSVALGLMQALGERNSYGVLHIDAHFDLRHAYEGFEQSHASIMRNATGIESIRRFVHVAVRDFCEEEQEVVVRSRGRHVAFTDREIARKQFEGIYWRAICHEIINHLPKKVYVSFDIDGLDPSLCPSTGTPVPGGLGFEQALYLVAQVVETGRKIIGFDLCEVAPGSSGIDENVGMRLLYRLASLAGKSCGKL